MKFSKEQPKVLVVGSCSIDLVLTVDSQLKDGETVMASFSENFYGGKGANQAVGTARLGASSHFVGCVGMDPMGQQVLRHLVDEGVNVGFVVEDEDEPTGAAYVTSSETENSIIVVPSANYRLKAKHIQNAERYFETADLVLIQLETPMEAVIKTYELAKKHGVKLGIYSAPAVRLPLEIIDYASFIVAKTNDLHTIFGKTKEEILQQLPNKLFLREDLNKTIYFNGNQVIEVKSEVPNVVHKMGMGDAFTSGFGIALCHQNSVEDCVEFASKVSARVAQQKGSQRGLPTLAELGY